MAAGAGETAAVGTGPVPTWTPENPASSTVATELTRRGRRARKRLPLWVWLVVALCLGVQFAVVAMYSARQYSSFALSSDFGQFYQGAWLIAHGHIDPWSTTNGYPFIDTYWSLIAYPLGALYWLYPHGVTELWLQDAVGVLGELVVIKWVVEISQRDLDHDRARLFGVLLALGATVLMVANPWFYEAMFFGVHPEAFAALFLVLAIRAAWNDRWAWAIAWSVLLLLSGGNLGGLYLVGFGLSLLLALPKRWWWGAGGIAVGAGWLGLTQLLGTSENSLLTGYAYLLTGNPAVGANVTIPSLVEALVRHPGRWLRELWERRSLIYQNLIPTGVIGLFSSWSVGPILVVILASALILPLIFLQSGFQNFPIYLVGVGGTALMLCNLARNRTVPVRLLAVLLGLGIVAQSVVFGLAQIPGTPGRWISVSSSQAHVLREALNKTPGDAEVIADSGVIGRFSGRPWAYNIYPLPGTFPVHSPLVEFILVLPQSAGDEPLPGPVAVQVLQFLRTTLHAHTLAQGHGVYVLTWHPSRTRRDVAIP